MRKILTSYFIKGSLILGTIPLIAKAAGWADKSGLTEIARETGLQTGQGDIRIIIAHILNIVLGFLGIILIALIIVSGFQWMTSGGNAEAIKKARERIINAIIGLVIIFCSLAISYWVLEQLQDVTGSNIGATSDDGTPLQQP